MKNLYVYSADNADGPYSELRLSETPESIGLTLFAEFCSPQMEEVLDDVLRLVDWGRDTESGEPVVGEARSARVLCGQITDAFMHLANVPFVCRKSVDTEFTDNGGGAYRHGIKSATFAYTPSPDPFAATQA